MLRYDMIGKIATVLLMSYDENENNECTILANSKEGNMSSIQNIPAEVNALSFHNAGASSTVNVP